MTDGEIATIFTKATGFMIDAEQPDLIGFARAIEKESRRAALEEAWEAVHGERLEEPTETHGDMAYERAIADCADAIRALSQQDPQ
jgi:hypothetical protein